MSEIGDWSDSVMRVLATCLALEDGGLDVDPNDTIDALMEHYGLSEEEAEEVGAIWFGKPKGTLLS